MGTASAAGPAGRRSSRFITVTGEDVSLVVVIVVLSVVAALLAGADAAVSRVSTVVADELVREGRRGAGQLRRLVEDPARTLGPLSLLRVAAEVAAAAAVTLVFARHVGAGFSALGLATLVMTFVGFVVVEVAPRTLGRQQSVPFALLVSGPAATLSRLVRPLARTLVVIGNALTPGRGFRNGPFDSEAELRALVDHAERTGVVARREADMIEGVFELGDTIAREVMVPRPDIVFIEGGKTVRQGLTLALRSGFSRIPVTGEGIDDIVGFAYVKDLARRVLDARAGAKVQRVEAVARKPFFVPDSKPADELLREMQASRQHIAVVVDEYGGTAGLVTIEDILEEIVGEITDEYDLDEVAPVEELADGSVRLLARVLVEEVEDIFAVELPNETEAETVGGLLAAQLGRVPIPGATVEVSGLRLTAELTAGRRNRIGTVLVERLPAAVGEDDS